MIDMRDENGNSFHWSVVATKMDDEGYFQVTSGNYGGAVAWGGVWWTLTICPITMLFILAIPTK